MDLKLTLQLPREQLSVPVVRRIFGRSLDALGVLDECAADIQLALTEACTNVLDHAEEGDAYEVVAGIDEDVCVIEIIDSGRGFDAEALGQDEAAPNAERGRGIHLMRTLVDSVRFEDRPGKGTVVHFEKVLRWHEGAPVPLLKARREA